MGKTTQFIEKEFEPFKIYPIPGIPFVSDSSWIAVLWRSLEEYLSDKVLFLPYIKANKIEVDSLIVTGHGVMGTSFIYAFSNIDLTTGILNVEHNLGQRIVNVQVYNNDYCMVMPDNIRLVDANNVEIDLNGFVPITDDWIALITY